MSTWKQGSSMSMRRFHHSHIYSKPQEKIVLVETPIDGNHNHFKYNSSILDKYGKPTSTASKSSKKSKMSDTQMSEVDD